MQLIINTGKILEPLSTVVGVTENKQTMPILSHIYFRVKNNQMTMVGTDTEVEITSRIALTNENPDMEGTLPGRKFLGICRSFSKEEEICIGYEKERIVVQAGNSRFELGSFSTADFPLLQVPNEEERKLRLSLTQKELRKRLSDVVSCMGVQDVRYFLNSALFDFSSDGLHIVATDGHRLAVTEKSAPQLASERVKCIVPRKGVTELVRLLDNSDENVDLVFYPHFVQVVTSDFSYGCKLIDANFPDYARVIPTDAPNKIQVDLVPFLASLRRCAILTDDKIQKVSLSFRDNVLDITAVNSKEERVKDKIPIEQEGQALTIHFNTLYLIDILSTMRVDKVRLSISDDKPSALLEPQGDDTTLFVVMPMKS